MPLWIYRRSTKDKWLTIRLFKLNTELLYACKLLRRSVFISLNFFFDSFNYMWLMRRWCFMGKIVESIYDTEGYICPSIRLRSSSTVAMIQYEMHYACKHTSIVKVSIIIRRSTQAYDLIKGKIDTSFRDGQEDESNESYACKEHVIYKLWFVDGTLPRSIREIIDCNNRVEGVRCDIFGNLLGWKFLEILVFNKFITFFQTK